VLDRQIENHLPTGAGAARLRRLMSEIEMWLFEHAVNRSRIRMRQLRSTVCGCGEASGTDVVAAGGRWTAGDDPFFKRLPCATESFRTRPRAWW